MTYPGCYLPSLSGGRCVACGALRGWRKEVAGKVSLLAPQCREVDRCQRCFTETHPSAVSKHPSPCSSSARTHWAMIFTARCLNASSPSEVYNEMSSPFNLRTVTSVKSTTPPSFIIFHSESPLVQILCNSLCTSSPWRPLLALPLHPLLALTALHITTLPGDLPQRGSLATSLPATQIASAAAAATKVPADATYILQAGGTAKAILISHVK
jgi:hypothetical protein